LEFVPSSFFDNYHNCIVAFNLLKKNKMDKKELRKKLEIKLITAIEDILTKENAASTKLISKTTREASKMVAKKFFKSAKVELKSSSPKKIIKKTIIPPKKIILPIKKK